jgi:hypothetical protein
VHSFILSPHFCGRFVLQKKGRARKLALLLFGVGISAAWK